MYVFHWQNGPMFWQTVAKFGLNNGVKIFFVCVDTEYYRNVFPILSFS